MVTSSAGPASIRFVIGFDNYVIPVKLLGFDNCVITSYIILVQCKVGYDLTKLHNQITAVSYLIILVQHHNMYCILNIAHIIMTIIQSCHSIGLNLIFTVNMSLLVGNKKISVIMDGNLKPFYHQAVSQTTCPRSFINSTMEYGYPVHNADNTQYL